MCLWTTINESEICHEASEQNGGICTEIAPRIANTFHPHSHCHVYVDVLFLSRKNWVVSLRYGCQREQPTQIVRSTQYYRSSRPTYSVQFHRGRSARACSVYISRMRMNPCMYVSPTPNFFHVVLHVLTYFSFENRREATRALRRCALTALTGPSASAVASQAKASHRHARRSWSTPRPPNQASPWKRSRLTKATGALRPKATPSWRATTRMLAPGDRQGRPATVPQGTRDHVRECVWMPNPLHSRYLLVKHVFPNPDIRPGLVCVPISWQTALCAKPTTLHHSLIPVRGARARGARD